MNKMQILANETEEQIIAQNINADVHDLALKLKVPEGVRKDYILQQIQGRQLMAVKCPLWTANPQVAMPPHINVEQASSQATAQYKMTLCEGDSLVDLTCGMGVDASFMAQKFQNVTLVEQNADLIPYTEHNLKVLGHKNIKTVNADAIEYLQQMDTVDCIFIDPARRNANGGKTVKLQDCTPDVSAMQDLLCSKAQKIIIKLSPMLDISQTIDNLKHITQIHIVAVQGECKELLVVLEPGTPLLSATQIPVIATNIRTDGQQRTLEFTYAEERDALCKYSMVPQTYLFEPNAAVLKSGAFKLVSERFFLTKCHINSHLYTSDDVIDNFPGRIFEVTSWSTFDEYELKVLLRNLKKANVSVRNFPMTAEKLRAKLKLQDGGDIYLFATTMADGKKILMRCKKVEVIR